MEQAERYGISPIHRQNLEQWVDISPIFHCHEDTVIILALVKCRYIIKIEIHNLDLWVVLPNVIPEQIYVMAPIPAHEHQFLSI